MTEDPRNRPRTTYAPGWDEARLQAALAAAVRHHRQADALRGEGDGLVSVRIPQAVDGREAPAVARGLSNIHPPSPEGHEVGDLVDLDPALRDTLIAIVAASGARSTPTVLWRRDTGRGRSYREVSEDWVSARIRANPSASARAAEASAHASEDAAILAGLAEGGAP